MTEFWKSNPRKQCEFCKCWIADNKPSIEFHEKGKNHQENVKRRLAEVKKKAVEKRKQDELFSKEFAAMEAAALKAVQKDLQSNPNIVGANDLEVLVKDTARTSEKKASDVDTSQTWIVCQAPQGHTYYYNKITGESQWEKPDELDNNEKSFEEQQGSSTKDATLAKVEKKSKDDEDQRQQDQTEREKHPLLGGWTTINVAKESDEFSEKRRVEEAESSEKDSTTNQATEKTTDPEELTHTSRKRIANFKEKTVKSLQRSELSENVGFKKRKIKNNKNVRKRDDDDD
ncbi:WW domain-binding protein 4-like [Rhopilema esculentum]|uniref:WW domain-binding protein 4-like n=1 Tax=Rhopilema esculentum TaxID=499914 RepID=UPI0031E186D2